MGALPSAARRTARKANGILSGSDHDETGAPRDLPGASSERVRAAWRFAERAHRGTTRRDGVTPYVDHAVAVAREVVAAHGGDDVVCAAYLHDVVEHEHVPLVEVATGFGDRVAALVGAVTDEPQDEGGRLRAWLEQKQGAVDALRGAEEDVVLLRAADLCANVDDLVAGHDAVGRAVWQRYEAGAAQQSGYYVALAHELLARLPAGAMRERVEACLRALHEVLATDGVRPRGRFRNAGSRAARA